jgi:hypothetical protein
MEIMYTPMESERHIVQGTAQSLTNLTWGKGVITTVPVDFEREVTADS